MTTIANPDDPDTTGKTVPPYDGRQGSAEVDDPALTGRGQHASHASHAYDQPDKS